MDVEKTIEFILSNQAKYEERMSRLETVVEKLADNGIRLDDAMVSLTDSMTILAEQAAERDRQSVERDRALSARIDQLVTAIGVIATRFPAQQ